jgi:hypothetical protein
MWEVDLCMVKRQVQHIHHGRGEQLIYCTSILREIKAQLSIKLRSAQKMTRLLFPYDSIPSRTGTYY